MTVQNKTTGVVFPTISAAITGAGSGDTIDISAGVYTEDPPKIDTDLTLQGIGGLAQLDDPSPSNGEAALVQDTANLTVAGMEIAGVAVSSGNGAAVRMETGGVLTIDNDWFHNNQDGLLTGAIAGATVDISNSEFNDNGIEDGQTHNIYIGDIQQLNITDSYFHDALGGHEIKSRALNTDITDTRIQDPARLGRA